MSDKLPSAMDYDEHEKSYKIFIDIAKYGTIGTIAVLIFIALVTL